METNLNNISSIEILKKDYEKRKQKNSRFSKRSYARTLGISSGRLTEIFNGTAPLTPKRAIEIVPNLLLGPEEKNFFLRLVEREYDQKTDRRRKTQNFDKVLSNKEFSLISDWEYFSFLALMKLKNFKSDIIWIAKKLNIQEDRANEVLQTLIELGYVERNAQTGELKTKFVSMSTTNDIPSAVLKKANADCIYQALEKLETVHILERDISSITIPTDPLKLRDAKLLIKDFKMNMNKILNGVEPSEVYNLNIQLVPVTNLRV